MSHTFTFLPPRDGHGLRAGGLTVTVHEGALHDHPLITNKLALNKMYLAFHFALACHGVQFHAVGINLIFNQMFCSLVLDVGFIQRNINLQTCKIKKNIIFSSFNI